MLYRTFDGAHSDQEVRAFLEDGATNLKSASTLGRRVVVVGDLTGAGLVTPSQRRMIGAFNQEHAELATRTVAALVFVVPNIALRGTLMAIFFVYRPRIQVHFVLSKQAAIAKARSVLSEPSMNARLANE